MPIERGAVEETSSFDNIFLVLLPGAISLASMIVEELLDLLYTTMKNPPPKVIKMTNALRRKTCNLQ